MGVSDLEKTDAPARQRNGEASGPPDADVAAQPGTRGTEGQAASTAKEASRAAAVTASLAPVPATEGGVPQAAPPVVEPSEKRVEVAPLDDLAPAAPADGSSNGLSILPVLTNSQREDLGLPELTINFVGMPTKRQPRPSALINLQKVYVGERIPGTSARLIGVEMHGIGIEVSGQQFFVPH
jgi:hypothetical protein